MNTIKIISLIDEDFVNYKKASMYIAFPYCTFKCGKENCQNASCADQKIMDIPIECILKRYLKNDITSAIVIAGLEPFDSFEDLLNLTYSLRANTADDIVIYTGYNRDEIVDKLAMLPKDNVIVKFGRYIPNGKKHYDEVLGIELVSDNQYAQYISCEDAVKLVDDAETVNKITKALQRNDYYCPCRIGKNDDTRCMCKEFRESPIGSTCHCGLYTK